MESLLDVEEVGELGCSERSGDGDRVEGGEDESEKGAADASDSGTGDEDSVESSMSECAQVYFAVTISSSRGFRKETFLAAGNIGRDEVTLRFRKCLSGLLESMEGMLW